MPDPGWYNDAHDSRLARWHDGNEWTQHTLQKASRKGPGMPPPPEPARRPSFRFVDREPDLAQPTPRGAPRKPTTVQRDQSSPWYQRRTTIVSIVGVLVLALIVGWVLVGSSDGSDEAADSDGRPPGVESPGGTRVERSDSPTIINPSDLARLVQDAGLGCEDYEDESDPNPETDFSGSCTLANGKQITLDVLANEDRYDDYVEVGRTQSCAFFGGSDIVYVTGDFWAISVSIDLTSDDDEIRMDVDTTQAIGDALDAEVKTIDC